jgi:hypothetical protein
VWLGFEPTKLRGWLEASALDIKVAQPMAGPQRPPLQIAVGADRRTRPLRNLSLASS